MVDWFFGFKLGQQQTFNNEGKRLVVTKILSGPSEISRIKTKEKDGYQAIVIKVNPAPAGQKLKVKNKKKEYLKEIKVDDVNNFKVGDNLSINQVFKVGDRVRVSGKTKGKGFAGVVKRWGFAGGPKTHGQSDRERAPGSIGQRTDPGRVWKGKKMAGRMGGKTKAIKGLQVFKIDSEHQEIWLRGLVPGAKGELVKISKINFQ